MRMFDVIFRKALDRRIASYQNDLITKHCDEVENIYRQMRGWRHDYHNHIQAMLAMVDNPEEIRSYLWKLNDDLTAVDTVLKTGNVMVDAILNSKLSLIKNHNIKVSAKATVPDKLIVSEIDLCIIIGNLLDNALEACLRQEETEKRFIRVYIGLFKQQLYICITNSTGREIKKEGKRYLSLKNSDSHGFGLLRIDGLVKKYDGLVNRQDEAGAFVTEIFLPAT